MECKFECKAQKKKRWYDTTIRHAMRNSKEATETDDTTKKRRDNKHSENYSSTDYTKWRDVRREMGGDQSQSRSTDRPHQYIHEGQNGAIYYCVQ